MQLIYLLVATSLFLVQSSEAIAPPSSSSIRGLSDVAPVEKQKESSTGTMPSGSDTIVVCQDKSFRDGSERSICAVNEWVTPSRFLGPDGREILFGPWRTNYRFVEGVDEGFDTSTAETDDFYTGMSALVEEEDDHCVVSVGVNPFVSLRCHNCTICGEQAYEVDCTNIPNGAFVTCQTLRPNIFYPFDPTVASMSPTAPTSSPTASFKSPVASMTPTVSPASFATSLELREAVDAYLEDSSSDTHVAATYGWPIGTWCVNRIEHFDSLFSWVRNRKSATFNEDISNWDVSSATSMTFMFFLARDFDQDLCAWGRLLNSFSTTSFAFMFRGTSCTLQEQRRL